MRASDIIVKKRDGAALTREEIAFIVHGYVEGTIPEYQVSALLMAILFQGMTPEETGILTREMIASGRTIDLSSLSGPFVDKHSTGGVGDKVSLILAPLAAACGARVPMMSGRSLGHTGGTLDKLESIPGYRTDLSPARFAEIIGACGFAMTGQSRDVVPADRQLYALRDVTGTVESVPLITSSILSKKFAEGADALVFDVKTGSGAFMKTPERARVLAQSLVDTGASLGKKIVAVLTRMDVPMGAKVGNFLEVEETLALLRAPAALDTVPADGRSDDLMEVTLRLTAWMLVAVGLVRDVDAGLDRCRTALEDGSALALWEQNVQLQGGDVEETYRRLGSWRAPETVDIPAEEEGILQEIDAYATGMGSVYLGVGRSTAEDTVQPDVGFELLRKPGDRVTRGEPIMRAWGHSAEALEQAVATVRRGITIAPDAVGTGAGGTDAGGSGAGGPERSWPAVSSMILEEITSL
jgi:pyrimidine-nucleoside phosphorylase